MSSGYTTFRYGLSVPSTSASSASKIVSLKALPDLLGKSVAGFIRHADSLAAGPAANFTVSVRKQQIMRDLFLVHLHLHTVSLCKLQGNHETICTGQVTNTGDLDAVRRGTMFHDFISPFARTCFLPPT